MRVLHAADLHAGVLTHSWPDPATGLPSRLMDFAATWTWLCAQAIEHDVDAVILAGDIFHTANPDAAALAFFADGLRELEFIPTLLIAGNHERAPHPGRPCVLEAFADPPLVTVSTYPAMVEVGGLSVATLPSVSRHQMMAADVWGKYALEIDVALVDGLASIIGGFRASDADVLTGHWPVAGSVLGGETDIQITGEPMLDPADLEGPWEYVAMGHIHRAQPLRGKQLGAFSGATDRVNFGEEDYTPGAWIVDIDGGATHITFLPTPARRFRTIDLAAPTGGDVEGAIVRVRGVPRDAAAEVRAGLLEAGAALVRIEVQRERVEPVRAAAASEAPGPLEALDVYLEQRNVDVDLRPPIRARAADLVGAVA